MEQLSIGWIYEEEGEEPRTTVDKAVAWLDNLGVRLRPTTRLLAFSACDAMRDRHVLKATSDVLAVGRLAQVDIPIRRASTAATNSAEGRGSRLLEAFRQMIAARDDDAIDVEMAKVWDSVFDRSDGGPLDDSAIDKRCTEH